MKIAFIIMNLYPKTGPGSVLLQVCPRLAKDHEIHIIAGTLRSKQAVDLPSHIAVTHKVPLPDRPTVIRLLCFIFGASLLSLKLRKKVDLIVSVEPFPFFQNVLDMHDSFKQPIKGLKRSPMKRLLRLIAAGYESIIIQKLRGNIIVHSEGLKRDLCKYHGLSEGDIAVVPNGVDLVHFSPENKVRLKGKMRRRMGIPEDAFVMLFVGSSGWGKKGLHHAVKAMSHTHNENLYLVVAGRGDLEQIRPYLGKFDPGDHIIFTGWVDDLRGYYALSDIFILPSHFENFSLVSYEAAASGLPVLATKLPGIEDLIEDGKNGFFIEPNAHDIAEKIKYLYAAPEQSRQMGVRAYERAKAFGWDAAALKWESALKKINQKKCRQPSA